MNTESIIILAILVVIIGFSVAVYWSYISLGMHINKEYTKFENARDSFSDSKIENLKADICYILSRLDFKINDQENFINAHSESEHADSVEKVKQSLAENKIQRSRHKKMLEELDRELSWREHTRKYK